MTVATVTPPQTAATAAAFASAFGAIEPNPARQLRLLRPMPGLPGLAVFQLDTAPRLPNPFRILVSVDDPAVALVVLPVLDPAAVLTPDDLASGGAALEVAPVDLAVLLVSSLVRGAYGLEIYANRRAPIFIAPARGAALQLVLPNPDYPVRQRLDRLDAVA